MTWRKIIYNRYIKIVTQFKKDARDRRQITKPEKAINQKTNKKNPLVI